MRGGGGGGVVCTKVARPDFLNEQESKKKKKKNGKLTFYRETGHSSKTIKDSVIQNIPILLTLFTDFMKNTSS